MNEMATAICRTLLHSLWEGLIFALLAGFTLACSRHARSAIRYNILSGLLLAFILCSIGTFVWVCGNGIAAGFPDASARGGISMAPAEGRYFIGGGSSGYSGLIEKATDILIGHASIITSAWLVVLGLKMVSIGLSIGYVRRIERNDARDPSPLWKERIKTLSERLRISRPVILLESAMIKMPSVFGFFKPVIFVPLGLLNHLPSDQMEAILIHELAHIKRNDYLMNLVQSIITTLFFFNPAVLWISMLIREERENCCDDAVMEIMNNKKHLVQALISSMTYPSDRRITVAFAGNGRKVLNRITRIVRMRNKTLNPIEQILLVSGLVLGGIIAFSFVPGHLVKNVRWQSGYVVQPPSPPAPRPPTGKGSPEWEIEKPHAEMVRGMRSIITDLAREKIIKDESSLSTFALTTTELIINGVKQRDGLQTHLRQRYMKDSKLGLYYGPIGMGEIGYHLPKGLE